MLDLDLPLPASSPPAVAPAPHHPDQAVMFPTPIDISYGPLVMKLTIALRRAPRQKCSACGQRRVIFQIALGDVITSPPMCARCAGIRR